MQDDIVIVLSQNVLQVALQAYAAQNFTDRVFHFSGVGLSFLGKDIRLEIHADKALLLISLLSKFEVKAWNKSLTQRRGPLLVEVQIAFEVRDNQIFIRFEEGNILIQGAEFIGKIATSTVNSLLQQVFTTSIIKLPIHIDVATPHANSTDEAHMLLQSITLQSGAIRVVFAIKQAFVSYPHAFQDSRTQTYQRSRAIHLTTQGIEAYQQGSPGLAASLLIKAVREADSSYELGWLWLSLVVKTQQERKYCLEHALRINPLNMTTSREVELRKDMHTVAPSYEDYDVFS
jgi:hypothetical protein